MVLYFECFLKKFFWFHKFCFWILKQIHKKSQHNSNKATIHSLRYKFCEKCISLIYSIYPNRIWKVVWNEYNYLSNVYSHEKNALIFYFFDTILSMRCIEWKIKNHLQFTFEKKFLTIVWIIKFSRSINKGILNMNNIHWSL